MKKYAVLAGALFFVCTSVSHASTTMGEATFTRSGETVRVDYIVSSADLAAQNMIFHFVDTLGDKNDYDSSAYYYYYQLENTSLSAVSTLTINIIPELIVTAGYIDLADIDDAATFNHNLGISETETTSLGPVNPLGVSYSPAGLVPHISWVFLFPALAPDSESTVFFISSNSPAAPALALIDAGSPGLESQLPAPIPEPSAVLLFSIGAIAYIKKKLWS